MVGTRNRREKAWDREVGRFVGTILVMVGTRNWWEKAWDREVGRFVVVMVDST